MEKKLLLKAKIREHSGSTSAAKLRRQGQLPAIVYGHKEESVAVALDAHDLAKGLHSGRRVMEVQIGKKKDTVMFKDVQYDCLGKNIIHVDLMRVNVEETVKVAVPVELKGTARGTKNGGIVEEHADHLEIECRVSDIPEAIVVSVKDMDVGDVLQAGDIELPDGVKLLSKTSTLLATCNLVAAAKSTEELEEEIPIAPEVIGEVKEAENEESKE